MIQSLKFTGVEGREVGPLKRALQNKIKRNVFSLQKYAKIICNCQFTLESHHDPLLYLGTNEFCLKGCKI